MTLQSKTSQVSLQCLWSLQQNDHCRFWHNGFATQKRFSSVWPIQWNKQARFSDCCNAFIDFIVCDCSFITYHCTICKCCSYHKSPNNQTHVAKSDSNLLSSCWLAIELQNYRSATFTMIYKQFFDWIHCSLSADIV